MGSRAVALVCRDEAAAREAFGVDEGMGAGAVWTRTGRGFFPDRATTDGFLDRLRGAIDAAGLWAELDTDWAAVRRRADAVVGQGAGAAAPAVRLGGRGRDLRAAGRRRRAGTCTRTRDRRRRVGPPRQGARGQPRAFVDAYGRYCWETDGLAGLRFAPFQVLAGRGGYYLAGTIHGTLALADRLVAADPRAARAHRPLIVDVTDEEQVAAGVEWWTELTAAGGEGMVVKPLAGEAARARNRRCSRGSSAGARNTCGSSTAPTTPNR